MVYGNTMMSAAKLSGKSTKKKSDGSLRSPIRRSWVPEKGLYTSVSLGGMSLKGLAQNLSVKEEIVVHPQQLPTNTVSSTSLRVFMHE